MKKLLLILLFAVSLKYTAQIYQYTYILTHKTDTLNGIIDKIPTILEIDKSKKILRFFDKKVAYYDSLIVNTKSSAKISPPLQFTIKKNLDKITYDNFFHINGAYYTFQTTDKMDWELKDETKIIDGYQVQKAITKFGGRQWNAWFCADIPFFEGPYKFHGLPGLIFEVYDNKKHFHFLLQKGKEISWKSNSDRITEKFYNLPAIKITENNSLN